jgi:hypothetical protein
MDKYSGIWPLPGGVDRYFDTALELLGLVDGVKDLDALLEAMNRELGTEWTSTNQVFFRLNWLRSLGMAEKNVQRGRSAHRCGVVHAAC